MTPVSGSSRWTEQRLAAPGEVAVLGARRRRPVEGQVAAPDPPVAAQRSLAGDAGEAPFEVAGVGQVPVALGVAEQRELLEVLAGEGFAVAVGDLQGELVGAGEGVGEQPGERQPGLCQPLFAEVGAQGERVVDLRQGVQVLAVQGAEALAEAAGQQVEAAGQRGVAHPSLLDVDAVVAEREGEAHAREGVEGGLHVELELAGRKLLAVGVGGGAEEDAGGRDLRVEQRQVALVAGGGLVWRRWPPGGWFRRGRRRWPRRRAARRARRRRWESPRPAARLQPRPAARLRRRRCSRAPPRDCRGGAPAPAMRAS